MKHLLVLVIATSIFAACSATPMNGEGPGSGSGSGSGSNQGSGSGSSELPGVTISGMVAGLSGTGLILRNNGGDELAIGHDGTFTFATQVQQGDSYDVSVLTQPSSPAQTCTVGSGSGTATNNVTDVMVTCATSSFMIGGTVVGLSGSGLVLQDNGGDDLHIANNGSFTFTSQVMSGATFAVTIETQPTSPAQTCSVLGNTGTVGTGNIATVVVNCSTDSFLIGGTIVGLAGTATLDNDGGDAITINANGLFAFPTPLQSGSPYSVTVSQNPLVPDQVCSVTNGNGNVGNANVGNVVIQCVTQTFTIGGTLSGLGATKQVTLKDNSGDPLTLGANGSFQFSTAVASGQTYAVSVSAQPAGESCTVAHGTGTVGSSAVTGVDVACVPVPFAVDVLVSGLSSGTLVLEDNGSDELSVTANGSYAFATKIDSGDSYDVTIASQPDGETCNVTGGTGTIGTSDAVVMVNCNGEGSGSGSGSGSAGNCPLPAQITLPATFDAAEALFTADGSGGADLISFVGDYDTATCAPCVQFEVDILAGGGATTPDFPTLAPNADVQFGTALDIDTIVDTYTVVNSTATLQNAYLATAGTLDVNALGTAGATFSGSVFLVTLTHYLNDFSAPAPDGCTTTVTVESFSGTEQASPSTPAARVRLKP